MSHPENSRSRLRKHRQRGSEMLEFTLVILPVLGFLFLILNVAWAVYSRATLQYAVAQGVRYAITSQTTDGLGHIDSIRTVVQRNAFGRLGTDNKSPQWANIKVQFIMPNGTDVTATTGGKANPDLPLVHVSVVGFSLTNLLPFISLPGMGMLSPLVLSANAWDRMEGVPDI